MLIEISDEDREIMIGFLRFSQMSDIEGSEEESQEYIDKIKAHYDRLVAIFDIKKSPVQRLGSTSRKDRKKR